MEVNKATVDDIRGYLRDAIRAKYPDIYSWGLDFDTELMEVYFESETYDSGYKTKTYKASYSIDGVNVEITSEPIEVKRESKYTIVSEPQPITEKSLTKSIVNAFKDILTIGRDDKIDPSRIVLKRFVEEQMISIEPMYCAPDISDLEGDGMDADTINKMVASANKALDEGRLSSNIDHTENVDWFTINKIWVNPCPCTISGVNVEEGQPICELKFNDVGKWNERKEGGILGVSIGGKCTGYEEVVDA